ncbi:MAG: hypothetical protein L0G27_07285 [Paracoccus sp. (in: a-proteobacteria)]|nr:hypothetical protein [Paracoccus sp. (in: a-proteobacteria)]
MRASTIRIAPVSLITAMMEASVWCLSAFGKPDAVDGDVVVHGDLLAIHAVRDVGHGLAKAVSHTFGMDTSTNDPDTRCAPGHPCRPPFRGVVRMADVDAVGGAAGATPSLQGWSGPVSGRNAV